MSSAYQGKNHFAMIANLSTGNTKISSPRISNDDTQTTSQMMPHIKGTSRFGKMNPSDRNFTIPGGLMLDTDSEGYASKLQIRDKLLNNSTTRNIRNRTIDVPELHSAKKNAHARSNLGQINSATRRHGHKKGSLPHNSNVVL